MKSRIHLYSHTGPGSRGYIVAERSALKSLARHLEDAARGLAGLETVKCYSSDGHEYELVIACDISEEEWQSLPGPNEKSSDPSKLAVVQTWDEFRKSD